MEDAAQTKLPYLDEPEIANTSKEEETMAQIKWAREVDDGTILLYTDRSKHGNRTTSSALHCTKGPGKGTLFDGQCQCGGEADIEDGDVHAIQEVLRIL